MSENKHIESPDELRMLLNAFQRSRVVLTAIELKLFSHIRPEGSEADEVASAAGTHPRATDRLLAALCALGLLVKKEGKYYPTPFSKTYLDEQSPAYLHGLFHHLRSWQSWSQLTAAVKSGKNADIRHFHDKNTGWSDAFIAAMHERAMPQARKLAELLGPIQIRKFLDIGGGSGAYTIGILNRFPDAAAVIFDLPQIIPISENYVAKAGLKDRTEFVSGDYHSASFGLDYDLILISAVIHINSPAQNLSLIRRAASALAPGGILAIQDHVMDEDRTAPLPGTLFSLHMLVSTENGDTYTLNEITGWMQEAGLGAFSRAETRNNALITGIKLR